MITVTNEKVRASKDHPVSILRASEWASQQHLSRRREKMQPTLYSSEILTSQEDAFILIKKKYNQNLKENTTKEKTSTQNSMRETPHLAPHGIRIWRISPLSTLIVFFPRTPFGGSSVSVSTVLEVWWW